MIFTSSIRDKPICAGVLIIEGLDVLLALGSYKRWSATADGIRIPISGVGGGQEPGETMQECAEREAFEEIGCSVQLRHSSVTYAELEPEVVTVERFDKEPAPLLYQVQHRITPEPYAPGLPTGERLHVGIYHAIPSKEPRPYDVAGLVWVPLNALPALTIGIPLTSLHEFGIRMDVPSALPEEVTLYIPTPSAEDLLSRVIELFGVAAVQL